MTKKKFTKKPPVKKPTKKLVKKSVGRVLIETIISDEAKALYAVAAAVEKLASSVQMHVDNSNSQMQAAEAATMKMLQKFDAIEKDVKSKAKTLRVVHEHGPADGPLSPLSVKKPKDEN